MPPTSMNQDDLLSVTCIVQSPHRSFHTSSLSEPEDPCWYSDLWCSENYVFPESVVIGLPKPLRNSPLLHKESIEAAPSPGFASLSHPLFFEGIVLF